MSLTGRIGRQSEYGGHGGPNRVWFWPFWQMTRPWLPRAWRGGDEFDRTTISVYVPLVGAFHLATSQPGATNWRCECGDLNRGMDAFCYRCGAGQPEDETA